MQPNIIKGFYTNDGIEVENIKDCAYIQIKLDGTNAKEQNAHMLVSLESYMTIIKYKWYLGKCGYPVTYQSIDKKEKSNVGIKIHKMLFGLIGLIESNEKMVIDHINRNKLDNRLENLRICSAKQNSYNTSKRKDSKNKYKGVKKQGKNKWCVSITKDGNKHEIKDIENEKEAAYIYDLLAEELFGEYAGKNFN
jgi:hypothetical protein